MHLGDKVCSKTCDEICPSGWDWTLVGSGGDGQYVCMSQFSHLCLPCETLEGCAGEPVTCDDGKYCNRGESCDPNAGCVDGDPPAIDDGIECTVDSCDEATQSVLNQPNDNACLANGLCQEAVCDTVQGCVINEVQNCCGNGVVEAGEQCDDANTVNGDGCDACELETLGGCSDLNGASGFYETDPDGVGPEGSFSAYCEMDVDGGGWTHVMTLNTTDGHLSNFSNGIWTGGAFGNVQESFSKDYKGPGASKLMGTHLLLVVRMATDPQGSEPKGWRSWNLSGAKAFQSFFDGPIGSGTANATGGCNGGYSGDGKKQTNGILSAGIAAPYDTFTGHAQDVYTNSYYGSCSPTQDGFRLSSWYRWGNNSNVGHGLQMDNNNGTYDAEAGAHMQIETYHDRQRFCGCSCNSCQLPGVNGSHHGTNTRVAFGTDYQNNQYTLGPAYDYRFEWYVR